MSAAFERVLGRIDLVLFSVSAILSIDMLASAASVGASWFSWWAITLLVFFVPYGLITAELGAAWPAEGGVYVWVREAFGPFLGSLAAWFYWINNAYWIPSLFMVFAATFHAIVLKGRLPAWLDSGPGAIGLDTGIAIAATWLSVALGVVRLSVSKWVPNLGALVKLAIFLVLGFLGLLGIATGRPAANEISFETVLPRFSDSLVFLPVLLYNVLGFELMSSAGEEMKNPQRDVPRVVLLTGLVIACVYALGILGILLAVPLQQLSLVTGTWDALRVLGAAWGGAGDALVLLLGLGFLYACIANIVTWSLGVNRVAASAAREGALPAFLARRHPRHGTPHVAFIVMGTIATLLLVGNALLSSDAGNIFWMLFKLSGLCFLFSYLLAFPAFLKLRLTRPDTPRPYRIPGGNGLAALLSGVCFALIAVACVLFFQASQGADAARAARETLLLGSEAAVTIVVGLVFALRAARRRSASTGLPDTIRE